MAKNIAIGVLLLLVVAAAAERLWKLGEEKVKLCRVTRVIDGDTIDVTGWGNGTTRVRLLNVDTPEIAHTPDEKDQSGGSEAAAYAKKRLAGRLVILQSDGGRGRYGRLLAYVFTNFNVELVDRGHSTYYIKFGRSKLYDEEFRKQ